MDEISFLTRNATPCPLTHQVVLPVTKPPLHEFLPRRLCRFAFAGHDYLPDKDGGLTSFLRQRMTGQGLQQGSHKLTHAHTAHTLPTRRDSEMAVHSDFIEDTSMDIDD